MKDLRRPKHCPVKKTPHHLMYINEVTYNDLYGPVASLMVDN